MSDNNNIDPSRIKQRETMRRKYGEDIYSELAKKGGKAAAHTNTSEKGKRAAQIRWDKVRKMKEQSNG